MPPFDSQKQKKIPFLESEERYSSKYEVQRKWLKEYGKISYDNTAIENKEILYECFNLLDAVAGYRIREFLSGSVCIIKEGETQNLLSEYLSGNYRLFSDNDKVIRVFHFGKEYRLKDITPRAAFFNKINNLIAVGYKIPPEINQKLRRNRNTGAHSTATVYMAALQYSTEELISDLNLIAYGLYVLGMLDERLIHPDSDVMRVNVGSLLRHGTFRVDKLLARGGSCRVYLGTQLSLNRTVAIKEYIPDSFDDGKRAIYLVKKECAALTKLEHPNIPSIYDTFSENGTYYIVMEYIKGISLDRLDPQKFSFPFAVNILLEICSSTSYLHSRNINHCYLDPANIMIDDMGHVHLIDFGISNINTNHTNISAGSYGYTAPEIFERKPSTPRSDVYSIGKIILFLLKYRNVSSSISSQNAKLLRIAKKASQNDPAMRYDSVLSVRNDIYAMIKSTPFSMAAPTQAVNVQAFSPVNMEQKKKKLNLQKILILTAVIISVLLMAVIAITVIVSQTAEKNGNMNNHLLNEESTESEKSSEAEEIIEVSSVIHE